MEPLSDLVEISTQVEAALVLDDSGELLASTFDDEARAREVARLADDLLAAAQEARQAQPLVQLQAATQDGSVFVVREQGRVVAATTTASPAAGLVFYDLRTCLRALAAEAEAAKPKRKRPARKAAGKSGDEPA